MGLFDQQVKDLLEFAEEKRDEGTLRVFDPIEYSGWPSHPVLVLKEDTALEIGNPQTGSLDFMVWSGPRASFPAKVMLAGPDISEVKERESPLCRALAVSGEFDDEYECLTRIKDAMYDVRLTGLMTRALPARHTIWCRVNKEAIGEGLSLAHFGAALVRSLEGLDFVDRAACLFVTRRDDLARLKRAGIEAGRKAAAMVKMNEEMSYDCNSCEYFDVCEQVAELKKMRKRLMEEGAR